MPPSARQPRLSPTTLRKACSECTLAELCLPMGLEQDDMERLDAVVEQLGPFHDGDHLYRVGDEFRSLYAVRSGQYKTYLVDESGREQVLGFHLPGELIGLDAIYPDRHQCNAVALDTATVCRVSYDDITALSQRVPGLQRQMFRLMSRDIGSAQALGGDYSAEERLAGFLLNLSDRLRARGYSPQHFVLAMPRRDIANYLRLAPETVSRVFKRFQRQGLIGLERREVRLLDMARVQELARCVPH